MLHKQLNNMENNTIVIIKYDNAGYTVYKDNTLKIVLAKIYTQKNRHGIIIYAENMTIKQIKKLFKQYKKMDRIIK